MQTWIHDPTGYQTKDSWICLSVGSWHKGHQSVKPFPNKPLFLHICHKSLLKHCGKRRSCSLRAISPFPTVFSIHLENSPPFLSILRSLSAKSFSLEESIICHLGKGSLQAQNQTLKINWPVCSIFCPLFTELWIYFLSATNISTEMSSSPSTFKMFMLF